MISAVVAFQAFILVSMILVRLASRENLLRVAVIWTIFTGVAVFAFWLAALQLITIWLCYFWLRTANNARVDTTAVKTFIHARPPVSVGEHSVTFTQLPVQPNSLDRLANAIQAKRLVMEITSELEIAAHAEKAVIMAALESARRQKVIERRKRSDPKFAAYYDEALESARRLFDDEPQSRSAAEEFAAPKFHVSLSALDPGVEAQIRARVDHIKAERAAFLESCLKELRADQELKRLFWSNMKGSGQGQIAAAFVEFATASADRARSRTMSADLGMNS